MRERERAGERKKEREREREREIKSSSLFVLKGWEGMGWGNFYAHRGDNKQKQAKIKKAASMAMSRVHK